MPVLSMGNATMINISVKNVEMAMLPTSFGGSNFIEYRHLVTPSLVSILNIFS